MLSFVPRMLPFAAASFSVSARLLIKIAYSRGLNTHPCRSPSARLNQLVSESLMRIRLLTSSYRLLIILHIFDLIPHSHRRIQRPVLCTLSYALRISTNIAWSPRLWWRCSRIVSISVKSWSDWERPFLKPPCSSHRIFSLSEVSLRRFARIVQYILPTTWSSVSGR